MAFYVVLTELIVIEANWHTGLAPCAIICRPLGAMLLMLIARRAVQVVTAGNARGQHRRQRPIAWRAIHHTPDVQPFRLRWVWVPHDRGRCPSVTQCTALRADMGAFTSVKVNYIIDVAGVPLPRGRMEGMG